MKTKIFLLTLCLLLSVNIFAQTGGGLIVEPLDPGQEYTDRMNYIFQYVDKTRITTGLLVDYGLQIVEPEYFDGIPADSNYVDMDTWKMLYSGIYTSKINDSINLVLPDTVFDMINKTVSLYGATPVAMMHYQYNQFREDALSAGLVSIVNDQIKEPKASLISKRVSPYITKQLFAAAPKEVYFDSPFVRFVFMQNLWHTNVNKTIQKREINFNNETGYITAHWNIPVSHIFSADGIKTVYFRLTYTDGTSYTSQTNIVVRNADTYIPMSATSSLTYNSVSVAATSQHSGGKIQIKYSSYNSSGTIKKPLIVAEGFDVSNVMSNISNVNINNFTIDNYKSPTSVGTIDLNYYNPNYRNLYNDIDYEQYDIIYLD
jgi:hypothetical protein